MINVETDYLCLRITELGISCISVVLNSVFVIFKTFFLVGCTCKLLKNILYNFDAFNMTVIYNCTNFACWFAITSVEVLSFVLHCAHIDLYVLFVYIQELYFWYDYIWTLVTQFIGPDIILMLSIMAGRRMLAENNIATTHIDRFCKWDYVLHRSNCFEWICYCSNVLLFFRLLFQWLDCRNWNLHDLSWYWLVTLRWLDHPSWRWRAQMQVLLKVWRSLLTGFMQKNLICKGMQNV